MSDFYCEQILSGKITVDVVMETEQVLAFHHTRPSYPVHIVVIPKQHISSLITLDEQDNGMLLEMMTVIRRVAQSVVNAEGKCRVVTNLGDYQESKHLHWHVIAGAMFET